MILTHLAVAKCSSAQPPQQGPHHYDWPTLLSDNVLLMRPNKLCTNPSIIMAALLCGAASMLLTLHMAVCAHVSSSHVSCLLGLHM